MSDDQAPRRKVWYDELSREYKHENGNSVLAFDVRNLPQHRRKILAMAGVDPNAPLTTPIGDEARMELKYVEQLLGGES